MSIALWIVQCLLGLIFVITGSFKFFQSREKVIASGGTWAEDFAPVLVKAIAGVELICGLFLIVTKILSLDHNIAAIAAASISLIMTGAIYVHIKRQEYQHAMINTVFLLMALFVVYAGRLV
jgi:uncharacterized membrane protein YphA (DoxX/SURF4 family)